MKIAAKDNEKNGATEAPWPSVLKIDSDEFGQCLGVARLAVNLWENKMAKLNSRPLEKEHVKEEGPAEFLAAAWELIQSAREHVSRPQTNAEYLAGHGASHEAMENLVGRILRGSLEPFVNLCDPEYRNKDDSVMIHGETWKVYRSERGFHDLFWDYWRDISEIRDTDDWKSYGKSLLALWKRDGVPPNDFLALVRFRRERDNRAENLKKRRTPKPKRGESGKERIRKS